jgi:hypothetical protein
MKCSLCQDIGWVCETHPGKPWSGPKACGCGAPGMACSLCNVPDDGGAPRMPDGFEIKINKDGGWLH